MTGYGEELMRSAFGVDLGIVETIAHYTAAKILIRRLILLLISEDRILSVFIFRMEILIPFFK